MLKKIILFSLALFIYSCGSDNPTNSGDDTFDIGIAENKEWIYDRIYDPNIDSIRWVMFLEESTDSTKIFKTYSLPNGMTIETANEYGNFGYLIIDENNIYIHRDGFGSHYYAGRYWKKEFYVKYFSVDTESWAILEDENDTTYQSGLYEKFYIELKGENLGSSIINFDGKDRKSITSRVTTKIRRVTKYPKEEPYEDREKNIVEMTVIDGIGVYEIDSEFIKYPHDSDSIASKSRMKLIEYREK